MSEPRAQELHLRAKRVLVTRTREQAGALSEHLRRRALYPLNCRSFALYRLTIGSRSTGHYANWPVAVFTTG